MTGMIEDVFLGLEIFDPGSFWVGNLASIFCVA